MSEESRENCKGSRIALSISDLDGIPEAEVKWANPGSIPVVFKGQASAVGTLSFSIEHNPDATPEPEQPPSANLREAVQEYKDAAQEKTPRTRERLCVSTKSSGTLDRSNATLHRGRGRLYF